MSNQQAYREGVVVVVYHDGKYLLIRRAEGILAAGAWCFVGGGIEPGEDQACAAQREFQEEVGGRVHPVRKVWDYLRPDGNLLLHFWLAEFEHQPLVANPAEVAEIRWCTHDELHALPGLLESNREFLRVVDLTKPA